MKEYIEVLKVLVCGLVMVATLGAILSLGHHLDDQKRVGKAKLMVSMAVLENAKDCGILDANGVAKYNQYAKAHDLDGLMALVGECEAEENFYDVVGETDVYQLYHIFAHENMEHGGEIVARYLGYLH